jgi:glycosyltransferase involved in cell wall biosynthesis
MSGLAALAAARRAGTGSPPVVLTFHALGVTKRRHQGRHDTSPPARVRLEQALGHDVDRVIATSTDETAELVRLGVRAEQISVVPCGVDVAEFTPDGPAAERGPRPRVLSLGRLVPRKGHDTVIRAMAAVPEAELLVAGGPATGELADDPEARRLGRLAERLGLADRVRLVGAVPRPDVPALLRSADVAVCAPWYEPFGMVPLEAMACGVPVVATAVGGLVDTVQGGRTGVLVPPRCPDELASALRRMLAEPHWRKALGAAGVDRARSRYGWDRVAAETAAVYGAVLDGRPGRGPAPPGPDPAPDAAAAAAGRPGPAIGPAAARVAP